MLIFISMYEQSVLFYKKQKCLKLLLLITITSKQVSFKSFLFSIFLLQKLQMQIINFKSKFQQLFKCKHTVQSLPAIGSRALSLQKAVSRIRYQTQHERTYLYELFSEGNNRLIEIDTPMYTKINIINRDQEGNTANFFTYFRHTPRMARTRPFEPNTAV